MTPQVREVRTHLPDFFLLSDELGRVIIIDDLKRFPTISKVARVDADLLKGLCHSQGNLRLEVDVCNQRYIIPAGITNTSRITFQYLNPHMTKY